MPRVLDVDDWAWRRRRRYGTMLVNLETNEVVDLLPDRQAAIVAAWPRARPGVEIVARDRAGAYADDIRQVAPGAIQVADRWHLLRNLGEAAQALGDRHGAAARQAAQHLHSRLAATSVPAAVSAVSSAPVPTARQLASEASRLRRQAQYEEAARLRRVGVTMTRISAELGIDRKTAQTWLRLGRAPAWVLLDALDEEAILHGVVIHIYNRLIVGVRAAGSGLRNCALTTSNRESV